MGGATFPILLVRTFIFFPLVEVVLACKTRNVIRHYLYKEFATNGNSQHLSITLTLFEMVSNGLFFRNFLGRLFFSHILDPLCYRICFRHLFILTIDPINYCIRFCFIICRQVGQSSKALTNFVILQLPWHTT